MKVFQYIYFFTIRNRHVTRQTSNPLAGAVRSNSRTLSQPPNKDIYHVYTAMVFALNDCTYMYMSELRSTELQSDVKAF